MNKCKIKFLIFTTFFIGCQQAYAAPVEDHFYLNGVYMFNVSARANTSSVNFEEKNGYALFGGYRFNSYLSVELGGTSFEKINGLETNQSNTWLTEYDISGYSIGIRGNAPLGKLFDVWASIGWFSWDSTFNYQIDYDDVVFPVGTRIGSNSNSGKDLFLRVGVSHPVTKHFNATLEAAMYEFSDFFSNTSQNTDFKQHFIGLGIEYNF